MQKLCAVSIDLDGVGEYRGLHGLPERERGRHAVTDIALPRALSFAAVERAPLTLFSVGRDLVRERSADAIRAASQVADVESHSWSHDYRLSRRDETAIVADLVRASDRIAEVTGRRPRGFRAPGYVVSAPLLRAVARAGMSWDASSFPCPAYYVAKLLAVGAILGRGRATRAVVDRPLAMAARRQPHRRDDGVVEIPMAVTRRLRLPVIGTSLVLAGARGAAALVRGCLDDPYISLELHGVDFLDARDHLEDLAAHQWDLRCAWMKKLATLSATLNVLRRAGYSFVTLETMAATIA